HHPAHRQRGKLARPRRGAGAGPDLNLLGTPGAAHPLCRRPRRPRARPRRVLAVLRPAGGQGRRASRHRRGGGLPPVPLAAVAVDGTVPDARGARGMSTLTLLVLVWTVVAAVFSAVTLARVLRQPAAPAPRTVTPSLLFPIMVATPSPG